MATSKPAKAAAPATQPAAKDEATPAPEHDRVAMVSYRADGTPDQSADFEVVGED